MNATTNRLPNVREDDGAATPLTVLERLNKARVYLAEGIAQDREGGTTSMMMDLVWDQLELIAEALTDGDDAEAETPDDPPPPAV